MRGSQTVDPPPKTYFTRTRLILLVVFAALIAGFYFSGLYEYGRWDVLKARRDEWRQMVDANRTGAAVAFTLISIGLMSLSLPVGSILSIAAGALFDLWMGVGLITVASTFGSTFSFLSSRYLFRDFVRRWFGRWWGLVDRGIERDGASYLLMLRLSPVVPFFALNAVMGLTRIPLRTFILVSVVGMLPSCFLYTMAGTAIIKLDKPEDILSTELIVLLSALALAPLLFRWAFRKRVKAPLNERQVV